MDYSSKSCSIVGKGLLFSCISEVGVAQAFNPADYADPKSYPKHTTYIALWDTGASHTAITERVINDLSLPTIGMVDQCSASGVNRTTTHLINMGLPNGVGFAMLAVAKAKLVNIDVLIGMDVITKGDLAITNYKGQTVLSYRHPSLDRIDFTKYPYPRYEQAPGKNAKCPCGSGNSYKTCCGR